MRTNLPRHTAENRWRQQKTHRHASPQAQWFHRQYPLAAASGSKNWTLRWCVSGKQSEATMMVVPRLLKLLLPSTISAVMGERDGAGRRPLSFIQQTAGHRLDTAITIDACTWTDFDRHTQVDSKSALNAISSHVQTPALTTSTQRVAKKRERSVMKCHDSCDGTSMSWSLLGTNLSRVYKFIVAPDHMSFSAAFFECQASRRAQTPTG